MELPGTIWLALFLLITIITIEVLHPNIVNEGFALISPVDTIEDTQNFFAPFVMRRGDIGVGEEEKGYSQDARYYRGYVDVQSFGFKHDFCRLVVSDDVSNSSKQVDSDRKKFGNLMNAFFACALAGTSGLSSVSYRSKSVRDGFRISRDDYMRDIYNENKKL